MIRTLYYNHIQGLTLAYIFEKKKEIIKEKKLIKEMPQRETLVWRSWIRLNFSNKKALNAKRSFDRKSTNLGNHTLKSFHFWWLSSVRPSWSSKIFVYSQRPNSRALKL